jgi:hypothetical protein
VIQQIMPTLVKQIIDEITRRIEPQASPTLLVQQVMAQLCAKLKLGC